MVTVSRRQLARYGADQLMADKKIGSVMKELAAVLVQSHRVQQAELLARDISWELEHRGEVASAQVTSATELTEALREQIESYVKRRAKVAGVVISEHIDESVIGGLRIDTAAHSWDKTLKRELTDIQEAF